MIDEALFNEPHDFEETMLSRTSRKDKTMDGLRTVEICHHGAKEHRHAFSVEIQRGSLILDEKIKYVRRYKQRIQKSYGIERSITPASLGRISDLFDGYDGGRRPENIEVEFYLGTYRMDITFSVDGRLEKSP